MSIIACSRDMKEVYILPDSIKEVLWSIDHPRWILKDK